MSEDDLITPERIAREAAVTAVTVFKDSASQYWDVVVSGKLLPQYHNAPDIAESHAREMRKQLQATILAALERFAREVPVPSPMTPERLQELRDIYIGLAPAQPDVEELLEHIDHLTRALHDCGMDGSATVWSAGYEAGKAAGFAESLAAVEALTGVSPATWCMALNAIHDAAGGVAGEVAR